ncbi:MAG TPA: CorA family divalent cation transporter, partial [Patescibacteria group bacterium]|nr:CorA family divalent cation transporter [Patescibacteria group bacterium]
CYKNKRTASSLLSKGVAQLLYSILDAGVDDTIAILDEVSINLEYMDRQVFEADSKAIVEEISLLRRNIIYFQTILKPQIPLFNSLEKGQIKLLNGQLSAYWGTIVDRTNRMWDRLEDAHELIEGLFATNESLVQFRTNEVIKVLTIFSVMLMPLTLLSGIYGMNLISLPLANHPQSFLFVSFLMLLVTLGMILFFRFKKWL